MFLKKICTIFIGVTLFVTLINTFQEVEAMRQLEGDFLWFKKIDLVIQSLPKGSPVKTPSPNPCTFIPGNGHGRCTLAENEVNFGAHLGHNAPAAFPEVMVQFGVASNERSSTDHAKQEDQSSS
ncbi:hypothetical protein ACH5RR_016539 [Cinchona calisaya]|uniref:Transmembrane protein n=1 Tax=Cinchona calisaya TaxID=153742 RepID=A0ABD2ZZE1_9GENT